MYEGRNAEMFTKTTGVLTWMSHPAQPSFVWQLYHYDLEPNASLYAVKKASETIHVQLNEANGAIEVVNNKPEALSQVRVRVSVYGLMARWMARIPMSWRRSRAAPRSRPHRSTSVRTFRRYISSSWICSTRRITFCPPTSTGRTFRQDDFTGLMELPTATLQVTADSHTDGENTVLDVQVVNPTQTIALMTHLQLHQKESGKRVLPVFYSDNYISLVPGESRSLTIQAATKDLDGDSPQLLVDGYNVDVQPAEGSVAIAPNLNAQPLHWPASNIVPDRSDTAP